MFAIKRALRKATQQRIATLSRDEVETQCKQFPSRATNAAHFRAARQILENLKNEGILDGKKAVGCYLSMQDGEVGTEGIVDALLRSGEFRFSSGALRSPSRGKECDENEEGFLCSEGPEKSDVQGGVSVRYRTH